MTSMYIYADYIHLGIVCTDRDFFGLTGPVVNMSTLTLIF